MILNILARVLLFASSAFAAIYGISQYFKKRVAMFNQLIVCGMCCIMLGRLFTLLYLILWGELETGFNVSMLGSFGGFLFLFSAGFGQMDGLVDGHQPELKKYRLTALVAPVAIFNIAMVTLGLDAEMPTKIGAAIMMIPMLLSSYYNLKQYIIPDVEYGILDSIRNYNLVALMLCMLSALELYFEVAAYMVPLVICEILLAALYFAVIPVLKGGSSKWTA